MILIFAGVYQGKLAYALERFKPAESELYKCNSDDIELPKNKKILYEIDQWILALVKKDLDVEEAVRRVIDSNPDAVVICNDISCGLVPVDPVLRKWREAVGKSLTLLSHNADEVIRLFCSIPTRIK